LERDSDRQRTGEDICWDLIDFQPDDFLNHSSFVSFSCPFFLTKKDHPEGFRDKTQQSSRPQGRTLARCCVGPRAYQSNVQW